MARYAEGTSVPEHQSRLEIERTLARFGADGFGYATSRGQAAVEFTMGDRHVKIALPLPPREKFAMLPSGRPRSEGEAERVYGQAVRERWRALVLVIKAKLVAVEAGVTTLDREFLPDIVIPGSRDTVGDVLVPRLNQLTAEHGMPELLPGRP